MHGASRRRSAPAAIFTLITLVALAALSGCGSAPRAPQATAPMSRPATPDTVERDGPDANPPTDLANVPDAQPRLEPIRKGGPNKPYEALGRQYVPLVDDRPFSERGLASWYGRKFQGRPTSSGEPYDMYAMTAAHPTLPIPSYVRVRNPTNEREVIVRVNDRGPFHPGRVIDLSYTAAYKLGVLKGVAPVELSRITFDQIRAGTWRKGPAAPEAAEPATALAKASSLPPSVSPTPMPTPAAAEGRTSKVLNAAASAGFAAPSVVAGLPVAEPSADPVNMASASRMAPVNGLASAVAFPGSLVESTSSSNPKSTSPARSPSTSTSPAAATATATSTATSAAPATRPSPGFWVQIGVFRQRDGADGFQRRVTADLDWLAPLLAVFGEPNVYRLQAGPYASRDEAQGVARRVRDTLNLVPLIVERR